MEFALHANDIFAIFVKKVNKYTYDLCCYKKRIHYIFSVDAYIFIKYPKKRYNNPKHQRKFKDNLLFAIIPLVNLIYFAGGIHTAIYKLDTKIEFKEYKNDDYDDYLNFEQFIKGCDKHWDIFFPIVIMDVSATIIYYLFLIYFLILHLQF